MRKQTAEREAWRLDPTFPRIRKVGKMHEALLFNAAGESISIYAATPQRCAQLIREINENKIGEKR